MTVVLMKASMLSSPRSAECSMHTCVPAVNVYHAKMFRNEHGRKIRDAREGIGETQAQFAARLGVDRATLSRWETTGIPHKGPGRELMRRVIAELNGENNGTTERLKKHDESQ
jgi:DNA-binding transcriptional regulator YiaG